MADFKRRHFSEAEAEAEVVVVAEAEVVASVASRRVFRAPSLSCACRRLIGSVFSDDVIFPLFHQSLSVGEMCSAL
jgi:hypothetical protein